MLQRESVHSAVSIALQRVSEEWLVRAFVVAVAAKRTEAS